MTSTDVRESKRRKLDLSEEFTVVVGTSEQEFTVPRCFLTKSSDFFKAGCNGQWATAKARCITLRDAAARHFSTYLQWLYTGDLVVAEEAAFENTTDIIELAVFGDMIGDMAFRNVVMDALIIYGRRTNRYPNVPNIKTIYERLPESSKFRQLLIDYYAASDEEVEFSKDLGRVPLKFFADLIFRLRKASSANETLRSPIRTSMPKCKYHEHNETLPKCS